MDNLSLTVAESATLLVNCSNNKLKKYVIRLPANEIASQALPKYHTTFSLIFLKKLYDTFKLFYYIKQSYD